MMDRAITVLICVELAGALGLLVAMNRAIHAGNHRKQSEVGSSTKVVRELLAELHALQGPLTELAWWAGAITGAADADRDRSPTGRPPAGDSVAPVVSITRAHRKTSTMPMPRPRSEPPDDARGKD